MANAMAGVAGQHPMSAGLGLISGAKTVAMKPHCDNRAKLDGLTIDYEKEGKHIQIEP
jgi:hypothetical protein